jgi:DNA-binding MarR family transcriptional regulator
MLGEPAWDMLLQLYVSDHGRLAIRDLVLMTEEPKTTALRWISYLEKKGLVERRPDPMDRRLIVIELLDRGRQLLDDYFKDSPRFADTI